MRCEVEVQDAPPVMADDEKTAPFSGATWIVTRHSEQCRAFTKKLPATRFLDVECCAGPGD